MDSAFHLFQHDSCPCLCSCSCLWAMKNCPCHWMKLVLESSQRPGSILCSSSSDSVVVGLRYIQLGLHRILQQGHHSLHESHHRHLLLLRHHHHHRPKSNLGPRQHLHHTQSQSFRLLHHSKQLLCMVHANDLRPWWNRSNDLQVYCPAQ